MDRKLELTKVMGSKTSNKSVHAQAMWRVIDEAESKEEKVDLLEFVVTNFGKVPTHPQVLGEKGLEPAKWNKLVKKIGSMVNDHIRNAFFSTANSRDFAGELLRLVEFFPDPEEKTVCLGTALFSCNIVPYHNLPGDPVTISQEELQQLLLANKNEAELIGYLVMLPFYDWTQAAAQVLQVIDSTDDKKLRVALLTWFMVQKVNSESQDKD
jgi:hypothetical protein